MSPTKHIGRTGAALLCACTLLSACRSGSPDSVAPAPVAAAPAPVAAAPAPAAPTAAATPTPAASGSELARFLPSPEKLPGWSLSEAPESYGADRLYEAINGGSERYLSFGFVELLRATYKPSAAGGEDMVVELYSMKTPLAAFGIYAEQAQDCDPPAQAPGPGCGRGTDRVLRRGSYFVKLTTYDEGEGAAKELGRWAEFLATALPGVADAPAEVRRFPQSPAPLRTLYLPADQDVLPGLGATFRADYRAGEGEASLFLAPQADEAAAEQSLARLVRELGTPEPLAGLAVPAFKLRREGGFTFALRAANLILVGTEWPDEASLSAQATAALAAAKEGRP